jgi:hypothetical protein
MLRRGVVLLGVLLVVSTTYANPIAVPWNRRDGQAACIGKHDGDACQVRGAPGQCVNFIDIDARNPSAPSGYIPSCVPVRPGGRWLSRVAAGVGLLGLLAIGSVVLRRRRRP